MSGYFASRLDDQQLEALAFILERKTVGLFAEAGVGKTWITLAVVEALATSPNFSGLIVVLKNNKATTWLKLTPNLDGVEVTGDWEHFKKIRGPRLLILHYEEVPKMVSKLVRFGDRWTMIAIDECQRLKARANVTSRWANRLRNFATYRIGLSGTPFEKSPIDGWAQMRFIQPSALGDKWGPFKRRYTYATGWMGKKRVFREERMKRFLQRIEPWCIRLTAAKLNLPPHRIIKHRISMPREALKVYAEMRERQIVQVPSGETIRAPLAITRDMLLAQITGGFILGAEGYYWLSDHKVERVLRVIRDSHKPVVVFCRFMPEVTELEGRLGFTTNLRVATYVGKTKNKPQVQDAFQRGEIDVLICTRAGGTGLDLYTARTLIAYSIDWSSINLDQLIKRVVRRGQVNRVRVHLMIVKGSIDNRIHRRIKSKVQRTEHVLKHLE